MCGALHRLDDNEKSRETKELEQLKHSNWKVQEVASSLAITEKKRRICHKSYNTFNNIFISIFR